MRCVWQWANSVSRTANCVLSWDTIRSLSDTTHTYEQTQLIRMSCVSYVWVVSHTYELCRTHTYETSSHPQLIRIRRLIARHRTQFAVRETLFAHSQTQLIRGWDVLLRDTIHHNENDSLIARHSSHVHDWRIIYVPRVYTFHVYTSHVYESHIRLTYDWRIWTKTQFICGRLDRARHESFIRIRDVSYTSHIYLRLTFIRLTYTSLIYVSRIWARHDSFIRIRDVSYTSHTYLRLTYIRLTYTSLIYVSRIWARHDSFIRICDVSYTSHIYLRLTFIRLTYTSLIYVSRIWARHDSFIRIRLTWLARRMMRSLQDTIHMCMIRYGVATISKLLKTIGLLCKRAL